jgi:hypothetical protein
MLAAPQHLLWKLKSNDWNLLMEQQEAMAATLPSVYNPSSSNQAGHPLQLDKNCWGLIGSSTCIFTVV